MGLTVLRRLCLLLGLTQFWAPTTAIAQDTTTTSHFEKQVAGDRTIVVFVHGILGDGRSTWPYWPPDASL
jgi:hypothetical protein